MSRLRLDELLVARGDYASRARARDAILRGAIAIGGAVCTRPGQRIGADAIIAIADPAQHYVSRAALKLLHGLDGFAIDCTGLTALDLGASTGGFTQVLLERGAAHVTAIDVGHGQLVAHLRDDPRVTVIEGLNARDLTIVHLNGAPQLITADVSFISLTLALPPALGLAAAGARVVALIKPQFEAGRASLGKGGIVGNPDDHARACDSIAAFLDASGWRVLGVAPSPLAGGDGNLEFLIAAEKPC